MAGSRADIRAAIGNSEGEKRRLVVLFNTYTPFLQFLRYPRQTFRDRLILFFFSFSFLVSGARHRFTFCPLSTPFSTHIHTTHHFYYYNRYYQSAKPPQIHRHQQKKKEKWKNISLTRIPLAIKTDKTLHRDPRFRPPLPTTRFPDDKASPLSSSYAAGCFFRRDGQFI